MSTDTRQNTPPARHGDLPVRITRALLAVAVLLGGVWLYARIKSPFPYYGSVQDARSDAAPIAATDQNGNAYALASERGKVVALFFGFTHCPNFCPLTLSYLDQARAQLPPEERADVRIVFMTLDPARDTPDKLRDYVGFFSKSGPARGLYLPEPDLAGVAQAYGVGYAKADVKDASTYQINHTTATYIIDRDGKLRLVYDYTQLPKVERVARDLQQILRTSGGSS